MTYATNALSGGFLLTLSLLPFMPDSARIVFNSSVASYDIPSLSASQVDSSDLIGRKKIGDELEMRTMILLCALSTLSCADASDARSKALQLVITQELARRLQLAGRKIAIHAAHPGIVRAPA